MPDQLEVHEAVLQLLPGHSLWGLLDVAGVLCSVLHQQERLRQCCSCQQKTWAALMLALNRLSSSPCTVDVLKSKVYA